jgi:diguanylate cyclase (GGDEF)-like protein
MEEELRAMSLTDEMTGLYNMRAFFMLGKQMFDMSVREGKTLQVAYLDLNGLKQINDTLGHDVGSELIKDFSDLMKRVLSKSDMIARLGGDEFAILSKRQGLHVAITRLENQAELFNEENDRPYRLSFSSGLAEHRLEPEINDFDALVDQADKYMYENKQKHKAGLANDQATDINTNINTNKNNTATEAG